MPIQRSGKGSVARRGSPGRATALCKSHNAADCPFPGRPKGARLSRHCGVASTKALYNTRPILSQFVDEIGRFSHPERALWLTDTYEDGNGVSISLRATLREIQRRDLPIDLLVCSSAVEPEDHLIVVSPVSEFTLPIYRQQPVRIPNFLGVHKIFLEGEYDRVVCSTEGPMGLVALYLKHAYTVPAYFYIHTDWIMFARKVLNFDHDNISRLRRFLRAFYQNFDGIFVPNSDQRRSLCSRDMGFSPEKVHQTAHWIQDAFRRQKVSKKKLFGAPSDAPVMLFAGRISHEKGIGELPEIFDAVKAAIPGVRLVVVGKCPAEDELKESLPEAIYMGWIDHEKMPEIYSACDLFLMPSRFDTFGKRGSGSHELRMPGHCGDPRRNALMRTMPSTVSLDQFLADIGLALPGNKIKQAA